MIYMEQIRGYPYLRKKQLMEMFQVSRSFVDQKVKGIETEIKRGRYNRYAIIDTAINVYVFLDFWKYEKYLTDESTRKYAPEFAPDEIAEMCGFGQTMIRTEGE